MRSRVGPRPSSAAPGPRPTRPRRKRTRRSAAWEALLANEVWRQCLAQAVADKKISKKTAGEYVGLYENALKEAEQRGLGGPGSVSAYTFATSKAAERMLKQVGRKKEAIAADILRMDRNIADIESHRVRGRQDIFRGLEAKLG